MGVFTQLEASYAGCVQLRLAVANYSFISRMQCAIRIEVVFWRSKSNKHLSLDHSSDKTVLSGWVESSHFESDSDNF